LLGSMNQQPSSSLCQSPFAAFLAFFDACTTCHPSCFASCA
jgi:hypothetical protein